MALKIKGQIVHKAITVNVVMEAAEHEMFGAENPGFCLACGKEAMGCEPDAEKYTCEYCDEPQVYGAAELLFYMVA